MSRYLGGLVKQRYKGEEVVDGVWSRWGGIRGKRRGLGRGVAVGWSRRRVDHLEGDKLLAS